MTEEVFSTDFSEMTELDNTIDINEVFENSVQTTDPPVDPEEIEGEEDKNKNPEEDKDNNLNIDKVFDEKVKEANKVKPNEEDPESDEIDKDPAHTETNDSPSSETPFTVVFAKDLYEQGLISEYNEDDILASIEENGEEEVLRSLIQKEITSNVDKAKTDLDGGYQEYLELIGKGVPKQAASTLLDLKETYSNITSDSLDGEDSAEARRNIITEYYKMTTRLTDEKISKLVDKSFDLGDDIEESKEYLESINSMIDDQIKVEKNNAVESRRLAEEENTRQLTVLKENIDSLAEIIPGQRINKQTKNKMYNAITKPIKDVNGNTTNSLWAKRAEDPVFFDTRLAYLLENDFFVKGKTWDKIKHVKTTKEASQLADYLSKKKNTGSRTGGFPTDHIQHSDEDVRDIIKSTGSILSK